MEERRTAARVLGIVGLLILVFTVILPRVRHNGVQTLSFKGCEVHFYYDIPGQDSDISRAAQNNLALCLCKLYQQKPDSAVKRRIMAVFNQYELDSARKGFNFNDLLKNGTALFDTVVTTD
jgi:hypothetical protein